jgi:hypothetical protein
VVDAGLRASFLSLGSIGSYSGCHARFSPELLPTVASPAAVQWDRRDANKCVAASAGITSSSADGRANGAQAETEEGKEEQDNKAGEDGPSEGRVSRACKLAISASKAAKLFASAMNAWCAADVAQCCSTDPEKLAAQHSQNPPAGTTALTLARGAPTGAFWPGATATAGARRGAT